MVVNGAKVNIHTLLRLKSDCTSYNEELRSAIESLRSALDTVGDSWNDPDFATISERTEALAAAIRGATEVVESELLPFIDKKISDLADK